MCFLDEDLHFHLRRNSQRDSSQRNISHLKSYRDAIIDIAKNFTTVKSCEKHSEFKNIGEVYESIRNDIDFSAEIYDTIEVAISSINEWNKGNTASAKNYLSNFVNLQKSSFINDKGIFPPFLFRGRIEQDDISKPGMYHIPFNKRNLVKNQRFSISGHPFLYLGTSLLSIYNELKVSAQSERNLQVSVYIPKNVSQMKMFDLTNPYRHIERAYELTREIIFDHHTLNSNPDESANNRKVFRKFILSSCCLFTTLQSQANFNEEYILPQLLTEAIRELGFDGIRFPSTQLNPGKFRLHHYSNDRELRDNMAFFTEYNETKEYDNALISAFEISKPMRYKNIVGIIPDSHEFAIDSLIQHAHESKDSFQHIKQNSPRNHYKYANLDKVDYWRTPKGIFELSIVSEAVEELIAKVA